MFQEFTDRAIAALGSFVGSPYFWLCLVVAVLLLLLWLYSRGRSGSIVAFDSETGHVLVSRKAINEIAQRTCGHYGERWKMHHAHKISAGCDSYPGSHSPPRGKQLE